MLLQKYQPKSAKDILGNNVQLSTISSWLKTWKKGSALLICGPTGCGKNLSINLLAKEMGYELVEVELDGKNIQDLSSASKQSSIFMKKKIILIEDLEIIRQKAAIAKLIENSMHPVVMLASNQYDINMPAAVRKSKIVKFTKIRDDVLEKFLANVCTKEKINYDSKMLQAIIKSCAGDVRAALIDLELVCFSARDCKQTMFELVKAVFSGDRKALRNMDMQDIDSAFAWIAENIAKEFRTQEDIANAYEHLSRADLVRTRILRRQSWNLQKYVADSLVFGISSKKRISISNYFPPRRYAGINPAILEKIAKNVHTSKKGAIQYMDILKMNLDDQLCNELCLDGDEIEEIRNH